MSAIGQRPEHLLIRDYIIELRDQKKITREGLRDVFVPAYVEMIPSSEDVPHFEQVHRHDTTDQLRKKDEANLKKLWRAIDGTTFFPLAFKAPLIAALELVELGLGVGLQKRLMHNAGLLFIPIDTSGDAPAVYTQFLQEFAEANTAMVGDIKDGRLDGRNTRSELLDVVASALNAVREIDENSSKGKSHE